MNFNKQAQNLLDYKLESISNAKNMQKINKSELQNQRYSIHQPKNNPSSDFSKDNLTPSVKSRSSLPSIYIFDQVYDKNHLKRLLAQQYRNIIKDQKDRKQMQKRRQRQIQREIIHHRAQEDKKRKVQHLHKQINLKNIFMQHYTKNQELKLLHKKQLVKQKIAFRENFQKKLEIFPQRDPSQYKNNLFKQFYKNYYKQSAINEKMYLQKVRPQYRKREQQIQKLTYGGLDRLNQKYRILQQEKKQQEIKKKQQLMQTLKSQILQKQLIRRNYSQRKLNSYDLLKQQQEKDKYNYYDTINNPVNLGVDPGNKYVLNHIRKSIIQNPERYLNYEQNDLKNRQNINKMSLLARSGSQIII